MTAVQKCLSAVSFMAITHEPVEVCMLQLGCLHIVCEMLARQY
jgi:hypothetical protein